MPSLTVLMQYLLPKQALTQLAGSLARAQAGALTHAAIRAPLKAGARPLAQAAYVCPVDGAVSQLGRIEGDQIFQAKGHTYSTQTLVGGDADLAAQFTDGDFATIYLSPRDYHRIHMPSAARLRRMIHVPGDLFSVNPETVGSMATSWHGVVNPPRPGQVREWRYDEADIRFAKGDEMGRFLLGSTVVLLWPKNTVRLDPAWHEAMPVRLGQKMAEAAV